VVDGQLVEIQFGCDLDRLGGNTEPAGDLGTLSIELGQKQPVQLPAGQVVVDLQGHGAFP
jgi:hypothetical protein